MSEEEVRSVRSVHLTIRGGRFCEVATPTSRQQQTLDASAAEARQASQDEIETALRKARSHGPRRPAKERRPELIKRAKKRQELLDVRQEQPQAYTTREARKILQFRKRKPTS